MDEGISLGLVMALVEEATGADPAVIEQAVQDWLDAHPEATTTVADGSITEQKLAAAVAAKINQVTQLSDEIDTLDDRVTVLENGGTDGASPIINTASGAIASFADGSACPARSVVVTLEPVQAGSGDPSPDNVRPITGHTGTDVQRTGKNLLDKNSGKIASNIRSIAFGVADVTDIVPDGSLTLPAGNYTVSLSGANSTVAEGIYLRDAESQFKVAYNNKICSFSLSEKKAIKIYISISVQNFVSWDNYDIQLEAGSTATAYEPYNGTTLSVTFPTAAGTVYGGTYDFVTGKLIVDRASVDLGTLEYTYRTSNNRSFFATSGIPIVPCKNGIDIIPAISSMYTGTSITQTWVNYNMGYKNINSSAVEFVNNNYSDAASFKSAMSGVQFVYTLATPLELDLTPQQLATLLGVNNVWSSNGVNTAIEYKADTKLYIDGKIAELSALIASL